MSYIHWLLSKDIAKPLSEITDLSDEIILLRDALKVAVDEA